MYHVVLTRKLISWVVVFHLCSKLVYVAWLLGLSIRKDFGDQFYNCRSVFEVIFKKNIVI